MISQLFLANSTKPIYKLLFFLLYSTLYSTNYNLPYAGFFFFFFILTILCSINHTMGLFSYCLLLKTKNWKYYSKIIFQCVNSIVGPIFNVYFAEKRDLWVPWTMHGTHLKQKCAVGKRKMCFPNAHYILCSTNNFFFFGRNTNNGSNNCLRLFS